MVASEGQLANAGSDLTEQARLGNGGTFHVEIHGGIAVGSLDTGVTEPMADSDQIDTGVE